jgi:NADPH-dependent 2,4-dienoyl-CoA reductase/sulfur reductase-like enzyme
MRRRHEDRGVRFVLGHTISSYGGADRVDSVRLSSGDEVPADVVVEAIGSIPNVGWLDGNGLDLGDGVLVDSSMTAVGPQALPVVAAGDVARHPNALFGDRARRVEHWSTPSLTGARAGASLAARLVGGEPDPAPFAAVPSFWSDQVGIQLQSFGMPELADRVAVVDGEPDSACIMEYHDERGLVGVVGIDRTADLGPWRARIAARAT